MNPKLKKIKEYTLFTVTFMALAFSSIVIENRLKKLNAYYAQDYFEKNYGFNVVNPYFYKKNLEDSLKYYKSKTNFIKKMTMPLKEINELEKKIKETKTKLNKINTIVDYLESGTWGKKDEKYIYRLEN